ncbi:MAG: precorrin-6y C5,15-methyltransferase (decarboxylating) subunit CbiE [Desulfovibrionaceae bacterium]|nr:precorrin-6y C5,15-methyltransferase (decarboxylating) subunit CbiE [Desulfovibrionaceae bacterium]
MLLPNKIYVLGFDCGFFWEKNSCKHKLKLSPKQEEILNQADIIATFPRIAEFFFNLDLGKKYQAERFLFCDIEESIYRLKAIANVGIKIVVLADGDPLFFGIGQTMLKKMDPNLLEIIPAQSSLQLACARLKIPAHTVHCLSFHGQENYLKLAQALMQKKTICLLGDNKNTPEVLASFCQERGAKNFIFHVLTKLGTEDEQIFHIDLENDCCKPINTTPALCIVQPKKNLAAPVKQEQKNKYFSYQSNLTVRATSLALLDLPRRSCFWDIGAGSGAVSFQALQEAPNTHIIAIEKNLERVNQILSLRQDLKAFALDIVAGEAPKCLNDLPTPDAIFIGGGLSGESGELILDHAAKSLAKGGRIVVSCVLGKTFKLAEEFFKKESWYVEIMQIQISTSKPLGSDRYFVAKNPVFLIMAEKQC